MRMELLEEGREREKRREEGETGCCRSNKRSPVINDGRCPVSRVLAPRGGCVAARGTRLHLGLLLPRTHRVGAGQHAVPACGKTGLVNVPADMAAR